MIALDWILFTCIGFFIFTIGAIFGEIVFTKRNNKHKYKGFEISTTDPKGNLVIIYDVKKEDVVMNYRVINGVIQKETINTFD